MRGPLQAKRAALPPLVLATGKIRSTALDRWRGLAIVAMMVDHVALVLMMLAGNSVLLEGVRHSIGRTAVPIFFVLAGYLCKRLRWRHAGVYAVGLLLPVAVPWIDSPNVLCWWALGCVVIVGSRWVGMPLWVVSALLLTGVANGWDTVPGSYSGAALWLLMLLGASLDRLPAVVGNVGRRLPEGLALLGRYPVRIYVGHLLLLECYLKWAGA